MAVDLGMETNNILLWQIQRNIDWTIFKKVCFILNVNELEDLKKTKKKTGIFF